jgi:pilus assembly protein CpaE
MQGQVLQILLISSQESVLQDVTSALAEGMKRPYRLHWVAQSHLAIVRAQDLLPQIILVDDNLDGSDPIPLIRQLAASVLNAVILFLVDREHTSEASQAVLVGARSFMMKPLQPDDLLMTLHQVLAWQRVPAVGPAATEGAGGQIVVFCAPKGGTGRTTIAINTAIALHQASRQSVVLVDADFAAPALDVALNLEPERTVIDLLPKLSRLDEMLVESVLSEHASGIKVLLAPPPVDLAAPLTLPQVQHILVMLRRIFPWVIIDLGLPMDETAFAFLDSANRIVMTVLPEMVGLRNTRTMLDHFELEGYPPEKTWLVVNRATLRGGVGISDIESRLKVPVRFTVPDDQALVTHTVNRGVPLTLSHQRSSVARAIRKLAQALHGERPHSNGNGVQRVEESPDPRGVPATPNASSFSRLLAGRGEKQKS